MKFCGMFLFFPFMVISGCDFDFIEAPDKRDIVIQHVKVYGNDELNDYKGKPIEFSLTEKPQRRTIRYEIQIRTKTKFEIHGSGFIVSSSHYHDQTDKILENMYLWVPRHDGDEIRKIIFEEINPGNISFIEIKLFESKTEIARYNFKNL